MTGLDRERRIRCGASIGCTPRSAASRRSGCACATVMICSRMPAGLRSTMASSAWVALWLWEQSPYGRYLDHPRWTDSGVAAALCQGLPAGDVILPAFLYAGGWLLMTAAMM